MGIGPKDDVGEKRKQDDMKAIPDELPITRSHTGIFIFAHSLTHYLKSHPIFRFKINLAVVEQRW